MSGSEIGEAEFRRLVQKTVALYDRSILTGGETASRIAELARERAAIDIFSPPDNERAARIMESCTRVVDEEVGERSFGDEARNGVAFNLWSDLVERPRSWQAFRHRCQQARELLVSDRDAAIGILLTVARSGDPDVGQLDDRQTGQLVNIAEVERLPELILATLPPQAMVGHGRVAWEQARRRLSETSSGTT